MYFMAEPVLENPAALGKKQEPTLTLKIHGPNGGAVTQVNKMLSSMNLEVVLMYRTSCDGSIVTQSEWSVKEVQLLYARQLSGSPQI